MVGHKNLQCILRHLPPEVSCQLKNADMIIYCNACLEGLGYWFKGTSVAFYSPMPDNLLTNTILYLEALCVLSTLIHAYISKEKNIKIIIYMDSHNIVDIFDTM